MAFDKKKLYALLLNCITTVCGIDAAKKFDTRLRFKRKLNLKHPQTLSDKVTWLQLHDLPDLAVKCTDKYDVRKYIREKGLEDILVPLVAGPFTDQNQIKIDDYPQKFVVKGTHGCKMNLIVNDALELISIDTQFVKDVLGYIVAHRHDSSHQMLWFDSLLALIGSPSYSGLNGFLCFDCILVNIHSRIFCSSTVLFQKPYHQFLRAKMADFCDIFTLLRRGYL